MHLTLFGEIQLFLLIAATSASFLYWINYKYKSLNRQIIRAIDIPVYLLNRQGFVVILEDFYNLFIYKRFERKVKIEVTNWQPCLFLRFAASCCQCLSSCCKIRNKKREYIKTSHDFFITGRFLSSMSISDSIVTSIFSKLSAMIAEIYTLIHTLPACCTALYVLFRAVRRQPCGYRSPASTHVKSVLSLPLRCARRN